LASGGLESRHRSSPRFLLVLCFATPIIPCGRAVTDFPILTAHRGPGIRRTGGSFGGRFARGGLHSVSCMFLVVASQDPQKNMLQFSADFYAWFGGRDLDHPLRLTGRPTASSSCDFRSYPLEDRHAALDDRDCLSLGRRRGCRGKVARTSYCGVREAVASRAGEPSICVIGIRDRPRTNATVSGGGTVNTGSMSRPHEARSPRGPAGRMRVQCRGCRNRSDQAKVAEA